MQSPLKSANWLIENISLPELRLLDCRNLLSSKEAGKNAYAEGHIFRAVHADLSQHLSAPAIASGTGGRHPLPDPKVLSSWLGSIGIGSDSIVICYDDPLSGQGFYAARAWWLLRWLGHSEVYVLDGGLPAYIAAGGNLSTDVSTTAPAVFNTNIQHHFVATAEEVEKRSAGALLIDSRARERYLGLNEPLDKKAGHIPRAVNKPFSEGLGASGHFLRPDEQKLRLDFGNLATITYCGSGVSATPNLLARELAGVPLGEQNKLYAGSWSDWVSNDTREIETGE